MTYKDSLTQAMHQLAEDPKVVFIGYGIRCGGQAAGTLKGIPEAQLIETPVAENLMVALGIGLALKGYKPVVFIERFDFILNALDAIVNHLDKINTMSRGEFKPTMILRVVTGNRLKPLFTGETHTQDFSEAVAKMVTFPVIGLREAGQIGEQYAAAKARLVDTSTMLVEYKDLI
ncbi:MAG: hypothetical protein NTZ16_13970 [Verrucomicrobia bacterium]|nr:hypothetical protein [Verrucomicrobiota bacterium]